MCACLGDYFGQALEDGARSLVVPDLFCGLRCVRKLLGEGGT